MGKGTDQFKKVIKTYLDNRAESDALFASAYRKVNKSIDECVNFIINEVKKSGCCGFADEEIYSLAVHYYDEDNLQVEKNNCQVVVNHTIELTAKEKEEARQNAIKQVQEEAYRRMIKQPTKKVEEKKEVQLTLF